MSKQIVADLLSFLEEMTGLSLREASLLLLDKEGNTYILRPKTGYSSNGTQREILPGEWTLDEVLCSALVGICSSDDAPDFLRFSGPPLALLNLLATIMVGLTQVPDLPTARS